MKLDCKDIKRDCNVWRISGKDCDTIQSNLTNVLPKLSYNVDAIDINTTMRKSAVETVVDSVPSNGTIKKI